jgi:lysozyme family protein
MDRAQAIALMLRLEGGYVDRPDDPGGATKYGITQKRLDSLRGTFLSLPANVRDLTPEQATGIYGAVQWRLIAGDQLAPALACLLLNAAVNYGEPTAVMLLQECVGVKPDGAMGPRTLAAVATWRSAYLPEQTLPEEFAAHCAVRYARLDGRLDQFELGWMRRLFRVYTLAISEHA